MNIIFFDAFIRFSGIAILLLIAMLAARDTRNIKSSRYLIGLAVTLAATLISYTPEAIRLSDPLYFTAKVIDIPNLIFVWLFSLSLFNDEFEIKWPHCIVAGLYIGLVAILRLGQINIIPSQSFSLLILIDIIALLIVVHLTMMTVIGHGDDLLEVRRKSRFYFIIVLALTIPLYTLADVLLATPYSKHTPTIKASILLPCIIWVAYWLLNLSPNALSFEKYSSNQPPNLSDKEEHLAQKLQAAMQDEKAYLKFGLTIAELAAQVGSTEHALRDLINDQLGYRHFSAYVNSMRIAHVKQDFFNSKKSDVPILTIALDAGFNSISPFNRAFKKIEGMTPSQFRREIKNQHQIPFDPT